jgi:hypothetical protein
MQHYLGMVALRRFYFHRRDSWSTSSFSPWVWLQLLSELFRLKTKAIARKANVEARLQNTFQGATPQKYGFEG